MNDGTQLVSTPRVTPAEPLHGQLNGQAIGQAFVEAEFTEAAPRHLRDHLRILYKYRWLAAACFGVTFGVVAIVTLLSSRMYTASTRLQVSKDSPIRLRLEDNVLNVDENE